MHTQQLCHALILRLAQRNVHNVWRLRAILLYGNLTVFVVSRSYLLSKLEMVLRIRHGCTIEVQLGRGPMHLVSVVLLTLLALGRSFQGRLGACLLPSHRHISYANLVSIPAGSRLGLVHVLILRLAEMLLNQIDSHVLVLYLHHGFINCLRRLSAA